MTIRVLLVDDEHMVREGFRLILETQPDIHVVGEARDGAGAIEAAMRLAPDVVLMDIRMRGMDGLEAAGTILTRMPRLPKVVGGATVKSHVAHVLAKLGLRDRTQAVVLGYEIGLVEPGGEG